MESVDTIKEYLVLASRILSREGLVTGHGHISGRIVGTDQFLIPARRTPGLVRFEDILTINLAGEKVAGEGQPNSETVLHTAIYRARSEVNSVCHTHSPKAIVLSAVGQSLRPLGHSGLYFSEGVPIYHRPVTIVNEGLAQEMVAALGKHRAVQLRGHGLIVVGPEVRRTCIETLRFEEAATTQIEAMHLGNPKYLSAEEIADSRANSPAGPEWTTEMNLQTRRAWEFYINRLSPQV